MTHPIAAFDRAEREALLQAAPAPHAAKLWHEARRRRAAALRRSLRVAGWLLRPLVAAAVLISFVLVRPESFVLLAFCALSVWLTRGACAPLPRDASKGLSE